MTAGDMYNGDETNFGSDGGMKLCQASASRLTSRARSNVLYLHVCVKCKNETASYGKIQKIQGAPLSFLQVEYSSRFKSLNPNLNLPGPSLRLSPSYGEYVIHRTKTPIVCSFWLSPIHGVIHWYRADTESLTS
jgi:hypothetical protein